jgi:hypothetical protein
MGASSRISLVLALASACNFPRPADVGGETGPGDANAPADASTSVDAPAVDAPSVDAPPIDAPDPPGTVLHVSPSGDDANDGLTMPVKTLKHAIGLAAANQEIRSIVLASGRYSNASGETFPYTVPPNVTVIGPAGGGATLAGTKADPGMSVNSSGLQDVDLEDFTTAITATGMGSLKNVRVLTSSIAVQAETAAKLNASNLEIAGAVGACAKGIVLNGSAQFTVTTLTTRNLGTSLDAKDQSVSSIGNANITGDKTCSQSLGLLSVISNASFALTDSLLDGGANSGILLNPRASLFQATISNTIVRNMRLDGLGGGAPVGSSMSFQMTGGELSNNGNVAAELGDGTWTFINVAMRQNVGLAVYLQNATLIMRGCTITGNGSGVDVFDNSVADLGTVGSPGNNVLQGNTGVGLSLDGSAGATLINAVGNTWNPRKQDADDNGRYITPATISVPVPFVSGNNFTISGSWSLTR